MKRLSLHQFGRIVREVMNTLPPAIAEHLHNVAVDVEEAPSDKLRREMDLDDDDALYGLFVPLQTMEDAGDFMDQMHRIIIFKEPLEEDFLDPQQLRVEIRKTVIHELAHHFGWSDRDLEAFDDTDDPFGKDQEP